MSVLCECHDRMTGEPNICLVAGPYWPMMMFCTLPTIIIVACMVGASVKGNLPMSTVLGREFSPFDVIHKALSVYVVFALLRVGLTDPGLFRRVRREPPRNFSGSGSQDPEGHKWVFSGQGRSWKPPRALYSRDCNVIIRGFDHTCPWTGTAIGAGNMPAFNNFTKSLLVLALYDAVLLMYTATSATSGGS
eukprot:FR739380.1.p1 GENE.FR739380.1~~FR739380.1.p1  ORF type:complete len:215 (+),score=8.62 FR739380.1:75-647(+)